MPRKHRPRKRGKRLAQDKIDRIVELRQQWLPFGQIAKLVCVHVETVKIYCAHIRVPYTSHHQRIDLKPRPPKTLRDWPADAPRFKSLKIPEGTPRYISPSSLGGGGASSLEGP